MPVSANVGVSFTPETARVAGRNSARKRIGPQLRKLLDMQQHAYDCAMSEDCTEKFRASHMRAYHDLTRLLMDLEGIGKPANVPARNDPEAKARNKSKIGLLPEPIALADPKAS